MAARYGRREELCGYRDELKALGYTVTARWLNGSHQIGPNNEPLGERGEAIVEGTEGDAGQLSPEAGELRAKFAQEDIDDILDSNTIVCFTEPPRTTSSRGGRHVEYGIALGINKDAGCDVLRIIVIGYRENVFCWLPGVMFYKDWESFKKTIA